MTAAAPDAHGTRERRPRELPLVLLLLLTSLLAMLNAASFPALVPVLGREWALSNTEAGWISGIFYGGYICAVPLFVSLTDHVDARRIYLRSMLVTATAALAFALLAEGFWSALAFRALAGAGLAGTYMPGLRLLTDRTGPRHQSRWIALYTASYGLGTSISFVATIEIASRAGWRAALAAAAAGALGGFMLVLLVPRRDMPARTGRLRLPAMASVLRNRGAMTYILAYGAHNWELFAFQSWIVSYLTWCGADAGRGPGWLVWVSWLTGGYLLASMGASILGAEAAARLDRRRVIAIVMTLALLVAPLAGAGGFAPLWLPVVACLAFSMLTMGDSAAITTGVIFAAEEGKRGVTLAVHSVVGFAGGLVGPLGVGVVLDLMAPLGGAVGWLAAFAAMALGSLAGLVLLAARR